MEEKTPKRRREWRSFEEARAFVHGLGLKSAKEWRQYCKFDQKPGDIPTNPHRAYKHDGWISWGDWLGTGAVANTGREYRPFAEAREFVRSIGLKSGQFEFGQRRTGDTEGQGGGSLERDSPRHTLPRPGSPGHRAA
jgi:hypothetical protein